MGLPGTLVEYYAMGYEMPMDGDNVLVEARISLPCAPGEKTLDHGYCFGEAVKLCDAPLLPGWGADMAPGLRTACLKASASTFAEAFEGLEADVEKTLMQLAKAYHERKERLKTLEWKPSGD